MASHFIFQLHQHFFYEFMAQCEPLHTVLCNDHAKSRDNRNCTLRTPGHVSSANEVGQASRAWVREALKAAYLENIALFAQMFCLFIRRRDFSLHRRKQKKTGARALLAHAFLPSEREFIFKRCASHSFLASDLNIKRLAAPPSSLSFIFYCRVLYCSRVIECRSLVFSVLYFYCVYHFIVRDSNAP